MPGLLSPLVKLDPPPAMHPPLAEERRHGPYTRRALGLRRSTTWTELGLIVGLVWAAAVAMKIAGWLA